MKYDLVVISTETLDSSPSVGLVFSDKLYLFNVPDQTQRVFFERKIRFSKLAHIFATSLSARSIGGFHGLAITVFDNKNTTINFSGIEAFSGVLETYSRLHTLEALQPKLVSNYHDNNIIVTDHLLGRAMAYEVRLPDIKGKFLADRAKQLGLKPGPSYKDLSNGKSVTLDDGTVITPEQVVGPATPGDVLFVVDCLDLDDVSRLPNNTKDFDFVVHFTRLSVLLTPEYLERFDANQKAICFSPSGKTTFSSVASLYAASSALSPNLLQPIASFKKFPNQDESLSSIPKYMIEAVQGLEYQFAPPSKKKFTFPKESNIDNAEDVYTEYLMPHFDNFAITFLGTGSMYPSKYRNVTGILFHTDSGFILIDAGEGTAGQLQRRFGPKNLEYIFKNLICIWISHLHGDHHFGLYQLLQKRAEILSATVSSPESIPKVPLMCHKFIANHIVNLEKSINQNLMFQLYDQKEIFKYGNISLESIPVVHCLDSYGCVATLDGGWRVAFSGDRGFNDNFPKTVGSCDLLIHEATFTDDLADIAKEKRHSTFGQAIETGKLVGAKYTIITHFSQRYPKLPVFNSEIDNIAFAFDYLTVIYEKLPELCAICPQIFQMIQELIAKDDE